ncbi:MAG: hypothetical protein Q7R72_00500 [bacterium]|nr:hypothetical protein [bacterium]
MKTGNQGLLANPQSENNALLEQLSARGIGRRHSKELLRNDQKMNELAREIHRICQLSVDFATARSIFLGKYIFSRITVANILRRANPTSLGSHNISLAIYDDSSFSQIPFTEEILRQYASTHVLLPYPGLSVLQTVGLFPDHFTENTIRLLESDNDLSDMTVPKGWRLVRGLPLPTSCDPSFCQQLATIPRGETIASLGEVLFMMALVSAENRDSVLGSVFGNCFMVRCICTRYQSGFEFHDMFDVFVVGTRGSERKIEVRKREENLGQTILTSVRPTA